ncbi:YciI family protein [Methylocystis echinoides]|uniref:YCII-related domain-containing protein n=1 Tax=Methylocystis echinoides TaxID=29468 RepID=A0A9W6GW48_9HYPH|nr:YciI family protein [Methylocystis echinoides]GLI94167.1 hypothetical protein LMG27198_31590 [Methylocystis echinoides]
MLFVALCHDKPGHVDLRMSTRPAHLAWLEKHGASVKLGGPFIENDKPVGSMLILETPDEASARALLAEDPYAEAGLFERVELRAWRRVVGAEL